MISKETKRDSTSKQTQRKKFSAKNRNSSLYLKLGMIMIGVSIILIVFCCLRLKRDLNDIDAKNKMAAVSNNTYTSKENITTDFEAMIDDLSSEVDTLPVEEIESADSHETKCTNAEAADWKAYDDDSDPWNTYTYSFSEMPYNGATNVINQIMKKKRYKEATFITEVPSDKEDEKLYIFYFGDDVCYTVGQSTYFNVGFASKDNSETLYNYYVLGKSEEEVDESYDDYSHIDRSEDNNHFTISEQVN